MEERELSIKKNNTSGFPGVHWDKNIKKWVARIGINYKRIPLGSFDTKEDAGKVYQEAKKKYHPDNTNRKCVICGSSNDVCFNKKYLYLLCGKHSCQFRKHGTFLKRTKYEPNEIIIKKNYAEMVLYNHTQEEVGRTKINLNDIDIVKKHKWCLNSNGYSMTYIKGRTKFISLHRFLLNPPINKEVDHINRNKFDNRRKNLRIVTRQENNFNFSIAKNNTSGVMGVYWVKRINKWVAKISVNNKTIYLGRFEHIEDATEAYKNAKEKYHTIDNIPIMETN